jgi:hypothetical protein
MDTLSANNIEVGRTDHPTWPNSEMWQKVCNVDLTYTL